MSDILPDVSGCMEFVGCLLLVAVLAIVAVAFYAGRHW